ncbi:MBL fold metallo-hydrolase [soil metagenome]
MRLHICGSRGSTPAPGAGFVRYGGHTSCVAIAHDDSDVSLLLDAGTGIRNVSALLSDRAFVGTILLSHLHWDHTHGLPFFRAGDHPDARVDLYLPEQDGDPEATLARGFSPPHFPIAPDGLHGQWQFHGLAEGKHRVAGFDVLARDIPHKGGRTFGYRITNGRATVAYLSDHHPASLGPGPDGFGPYHEAACELAADADVLLHDAQYLASEWPERAAFGHSTVDYAVGLAQAAGVGRLVLYHHDPARTDDEIVALTQRACDQAAVDVVAAAEGDEFTLPSGDG